MTNYGIKIFITDSGDPSVGINPNNMTVELNWTINDKEDRERLRDIFKEIAENYLDIQII